MKPQPLKVVRSCTTQMGKFFPSSRTHFTITCELENVFCWYPKLPWVQLSLQVIETPNRYFTCTSSFKNWLYSLFVIFLTFQIWCQQGLPSEAGEKDPSSLLSHDNTWWMWGWWLDSGDENGWFKGKHETILIKIHKKIVVSSLL